MNIDYYMNESTSTVMCFNGEAYFPLGRRQQRRVPDTRNFCSSSATGFSCKIDPFVTVTNLKNLSHQIV